MKVYTHITVVLTSLLMSATASLMAQSVQQMQVVEYMGQESKQPLAGVSVAVVNAPVAISDEAGSIALSFRTLHDGDKVNVRRIEKAGYEVFNKQAVDQWVVSSSSPFRLVLCQSERFREICDQYMAKASAHYEVQYRRDQERLAQQLKEAQLKESEYQQRLAALEAQYNQQLDNLDNYVDRFARIDLETLSEDQRAIVALIQQGRFEEAIAAYEEADYLSQYKRENEELLRAQAAARQLETVVEQKVRNKEQLYQAIRNQVNAYALAGGFDNQNKIRELLKAAVEADTTNVSAAHDYFEYLNLQLLTDEVEAFFPFMLRLYQNSLANRLWIYTYLASTYGRSQQYQKRTECLNRAREEALPAIQRGEGDSGADENYAGLIFRIAETYALIGEYAKAQQYADEAEPLLQKIYREREDDMNLYNWVLVRSIQADAMARLDSTRYQEALAVFDQQKAAVRPLLDSEDMMDAYNLILQRESNLADAMVDAQRCYQIEKENYELCKRLYAKNPQRHELSFIITILNLTTSCEDFGDWDDQHRLASEGYELYTRFKERTQQGAPIYEFVVCSNCAISFQHQGNLPQAQLFARRALDAYQDMDPDIAEGGQKSFINGKKKMEKILETVNNE